MTDCICGCGEPAVYAAGHVIERFRHGITEADYAIEDRGYETPCWIWRLEIQRNGYGRLARRGVRLLAHRASYQQFIGPIPEGLQVHHLCDVPPCVNPAHLVAVTVAENNQFKRFHTKLTADAVREIRESPEPTRVLAAKFSVSEMTIYQVRRGDSWKNVHPVTGPRRRPGRPRTITDEQEDEILASSETHVALAERFGVSTHTIYRIRRGKQWVES